MYYVSEMCYQLRKLVKHCRKSLIVVARVKCSLIVVARVKCLLELFCICKIEWHRFILFDNTEHSSL